MQKHFLFRLFVFLLLFFHTRLFSKDLSEIKSWLYQLQHADLNKVAQSDFDLVVMDYSKDGTGDQAYSRDEIQTLQNKNERMVLAYLSIGEAEDYRDYWQSDWEPGDPVWLDEENPEWEGNYKVLYWHPGWQQIILDYLKEIQKAGFDGIYLDLIDAYESYLHFSSVQSWKAMVDFVRMLRDSARVTDPEFIIIGQNAPELIEYDPGYAGVIEGIGQEDMYYGYDGDGIKTSNKITHEIEAWLDQYKQAGKIVLTVDYPFSQSEAMPHFDQTTVLKIKDAYEQSRYKNYVPYCTVRNLNYLTLNPGHNRLYYVDQSHSAASDTNPGTLALPFKTIQQAIDVLQPGEKVWVKQGIYYESLQTRRHGTKTEDCFSPILIKNYPQHLVIIDGTNVNTSSTGFRIAHDYIHMSGILLQNWDTGIWIDQSGFTRIDSCTVRDVWYGIGAANGAHHFELNDTEITRFMLYGFDASPSGGDPCHHGVLNRCVAHTGADPEQNVDGFAFGHGNQYHFVLNQCTAYDVFDGFDISARNTTLNGCEAYRCGWGGVKIWQDSVRLKNCIIHHNHVTNIELDWDGTQGTTQLIHCTIYNGGTWNINAYDNPSDQLVMYNCIVAGGNNVGILIQETNYQGDYNLFHINNPPRMIGGNEQDYALNEIDTGLWTEKTGQDSHTVVVYADTALFVDPENYDFHLKSNAPAIDQGCTGFEVLADFDGKLRAGQGVRPDIGAYEYVNETGIKELKSKYVSSFILKANYPNPFNHATCFVYQIVDLGDVMFRILNVKGQLVWEKKLENQPPGHYYFTWQGQTIRKHLLTSGVYILQMIHHRNMQTRKFILIR